MFTKISNIMKKFLLSMLMILFLGISSFAQTLADYTFSTVTDEDKWITLSTTTSIISPGAGDAGKSVVMDIGFSFTFGMPTALPVPTVLLTTQMAFMDCGP